MNRSLGGASRCGYRKKAHKKPPSLLVAESGGSLVFIIFLILIAYVLFNEVFSCVTYTCSDILEESYHEEEC